MTQQHTSKTNSIQCDESPNGCLKCAKSRMICPGYDRNVDAFHDETAKTQVKAKKAKAKAIALRDARDTIRAPSVGSGKPSSLSPVAPDLFLPGTLSDQGITYFMSRYAIGLDQPSIQSEAYNKHLTTNGFHPLIATSMTALGLAGVANIYRDTALKDRATRWYLDAIKMTNSAITHPTQVKMDTTLLAITLLGMFEATSNEYSLNEWTEHVAGAASLVKMRGMEQFASPAGRRMYFHTIGLLTMTCMGQGSALPPYVREMNEEIMKHTNGKDPRILFFVLQQDVIDFRAEIMQNPSLSLDTILDRALELDATAESIFDHTGPEWSYQEFSRLDSNPLVFGDTYHIYPSHAAAQTWNWVRYNKIYIHDIIRNTILTGLSTTPPTFSSTEHLQQLAKSIGQLQKVQSDILASMPQFLHDVPKVAPDPPSGPNTPLLLLPTILSTTSSFSSPNSIASQASYSPRQPFPAPHKLLFKNFVSESVPTDPSLLSSDHVNDRLPIMRISGGHSTIWALFVAGAMPTADHKAQDFVLRCLDRFAGEFGIMQAKVLAVALKLKMIGKDKDDICPSYLPKQGSPYVIPPEEKEGRVEEVR